MGNKIIVYHNSRCSKSRCALAYLDDKKVEYEIVEYLKDVPTKDELTNIIKMLGILPEGLVRKGEPDFKENFKGRELTNNEWIEAMIQYPKLIERPIVIKNNKAVIARPTERIDELV
ncbi:MAG: arsenate reductase (glutaredoxin) [Crocinitomicaceae bacterium]|jgi:arsenate reductase (glutaredoxin)|nr:arsenate reductase (glutaredoxin) [Crocinitomicaceae bacterium]